MFDVNAFMARKRLKQKDLAKMFNCSMGMVASWCVGRKAPSYKYIVELIKNGMTMQELFGAEIAEIIYNQRESLDSDSMKAGVKEMVEEILKEKFTK